MFGDATLKINALMKRMEASKKTDWQYFSKDSKDGKNEPSDSTKLLSTELKLLTSGIRSMMREGMGYRPMRIVLTIPFQLTTTVTSGVLNGNVSVVPGTSTEFASLATIFDEYKCIGGDVVFANYIRASYAFGVTGSTLNTSAMVLVYDTDSTALTSVLNGTEFMNHKLYRIGQQAGGVQSFKETFENFAFKVPPGIGVDTVTPIVESGEWVPTTNTSSTFGFVKTYCVTTEVVALAVVSGYMKMECEFRCRQ